MSTVKHSTYLRLICGVLTWVVCRPTLRVVDGLVKELISRGKLFPKEEAMCQTSVSRTMLYANCLTSALRRLDLVSKGSAMLPHEQITVMCNRRYSRI